MGLKEWYEKNGFHYDGRGYFPGYINASLGLSVAYYAKEGILRVFGEDMRYTRTPLFLADLKCPPIGDIPQDTFAALNKFVVTRTLER